MTDNKAAIDDAISDVLNDQIICGLSSSASVNITKSDHCCLCGVLRRPTQAPVESFGHNDLVIMANHRPMLTGRWEASPQLRVSVSMYRNGGIAPGKTHMCDDCIVVGLMHAKAFVDKTLRALGKLH